MKRLLLAFLLLVGPIWADTTMQIRNGVLTTDMNANTFKIINLALPISPNDAANKAYVDANAGGGGGGGGAGLPIMAGQQGKFLTTDGTIALWSLVPWTALTGTPTTLLGYGITDPIVLSTGSYSNPTWITSLVWSKITGTPTTLTGYGIPIPLPISAIPTGTSSSTVAIGNDSRFSSNVTGLRKGAGAGINDVAATPNIDYVTPDNSGRLALNAQLHDNDLDSLAGFTSTGIIPWRKADGLWQAVSVVSPLTFDPLTGVLTSTATGSGGVGDVSSDITTNAPNQVALFNSTQDGKHITSASSFTGVAFLSSGVLSASPQLIAPRGGTGIGSYVVGDMLYASSSNTLVTLGANGLAVNKYLRSVNAGVPSWSQIDFGDLSNVPAFLRTANNLSELTPTAATARANLGLVIGPSVSPAATVEAWDADLDSLAAFNGSATSGMVFRNAIGDWRTISVTGGLLFSVDVSGNGTLKLAGTPANVISDSVTPNPTPVPNQLAVFSDNSGLHIKASTLTAASMVKTDSVTAGLLAPAAINKDFGLPTEGTFNDLGNPTTPAIWPSGKQVMNETSGVGAGLTQDRNARLPLAADFAPGTIITYIDNKTTGNFGRSFQAFANGTDRLDEVLQSAGIWLKPFIAGGLVSGQGVYQFKTDGVSRWVSIYADGRASKVQSPIDATKVAIFNVEGLSALRTVTFPDIDTTIPAPFPSTTTPKQQFFTAFNPNGSFTTDFVGQGDVQQNEAVVGAISVPINNGATSVKFNTVLTTDITVTLPDATTYASGDSLRLYDVTGNPNGKIVHLVTVNGSQTVNGGTTIDINDPAGKYFQRILIADPAGAGTWSLSGAQGNSTVLAPAPFTDVARSGSNATLTCQSNLYSQENNILTLTTSNTNLSIVGAQNGRGGRLKIRQVAGGSTVNLPANSFTPANGAGALNLTSAAGAEDEFYWDFDGSNYNFYPVGYNFTKSAAVFFNNAAEDTTTGQATTNSFKLSDVTASRYVASRLIAVGGVSTPITNGSTYTIGKVRVRAFKTVTTGDPVATFNCAIYDDNGVTATSSLPSTQHGSQSTVGIPGSAFPTSEGDVDFDPVASGLIGPRQVTSITSVATGTNLAGTAGQFLPGDVGCIVTGAGAGVAANTKITAVDPTGANATISIAATGGTGTVTVSHIYWIVIWGDQIEPVSSNYVQWAFHTAPTAAVTVFARKTISGAWSGGFNTQQQRYITYKQ